MQRLAAIVLGALSLLLSAGAQSALGQEATPAEQFNALAKEFQMASSSGRALSDEERMKFVGEVYRHRDRISAKLVELAEKYPDDPIALDALMLAVWQVNGTPWPAQLVGKDQSVSKAFQLLTRDHLQ